jgi:hypothetical protein
VISLSSFNYPVNHNLKLNGKFQKKFPSVCPEHASPLCPVCPSHISYPLVRHLVDISVTRSSGIIVLQFKWSFFYLMMAPKHKSVMLAIWMCQRETYYNMHLCIEEEKTTKKRSIARHGDAW